MKYLFTTLLLILSLNLTAQKTYTVGLNTGANLVQTETFERGVTTNLELGITHWQDKDFAYEIKGGTGYFSYYSQDLAERVKGINTYAMLGIGDPDALFLYLGAGYNSGNQKPHVFTSLDVRVIDFGPEKEYSLFLRGTIGGYINPSVNSIDNSDIYMSGVIGVNYTLGKPYKVK